jgi:hypothetical protein
MIEVLRHRCALTVGHAVLAQVPARMFDVTTRRLPPPCRASHALPACVDSPCHEGCAGFAVPPA